MVLLGVVGQEPVLFRGSIYENITIGCPEATMEEVQRVAIMAYAHEFITRLPNVSAITRTHVIFYKTIIFFFKPKPHLCRAMIL